MRHYSHHLRRGHRGKVSRPRVRPYALTAGLVLAVLITSGCDSKRVKPPATFPVTGKVIGPNGRPVVGAQVQFKPNSSPAEMQSSGLADANGAFTLSLLFREQKVPGAIEGPHRVVVYMPLNTDRSGGDRFEIEQTFVVEPRENAFTVTLPAARP
jgi:hypothetical protein